MQIIAGSPGRGAVDYLPHMIGKLFQTQHIEIGHIVGMHPEFVIIGIVAELAGKRIVNEGDLALDFHAQGVVQLEIVGHTANVAAREDHQH